MQITLVLAVPAGTRVTLVHDGFAGTDGRRRTMQAYERGADKHQVLQQPPE